MAHTPGRIQRVELQTKMLFICGGAGITIKAMPMICIILLIGCARDDEQPTRGVTGELLEVDRCFQLKHFGRVAFHYDKLLPTFNERARAERSATAATKVFWFFFSKKNCFLFCRQRVVCLHQALQPIRKNVRVDLCS